MALMFDEGLGLVVGINDRPRYSIRKSFVALLMVAALLWVLIFGLYRTATAQDSTAKTPTTWYIFADTANIAPASQLGPNVYTTWVFARATPTSWPSSGILVAWNCANRTVLRLAQVKYQMNADTAGVNGPIETVDRPWQPVSDERLYTLVCAIGPTHADESKQPTIFMPFDSLAPRPPSPYTDA